MCILRKIHINIIFIVYECRGHCILTFFSHQCMGAWVRWYHHRCQGAWWVDNQTWWGLACTCHREECSRFQHKCNRLTRYNSTRLVAVFLWLMFFSNVPASQIENVCTVQQYWGRKVENSFTHITRFLFHRDMQYFCQWCVMFIWENRIYKPLAFHK